jgi:hypothetical protein
MALEGVTIAGVPVDPCHISVESATISHGRGSVSDPPNASTATVTLIVPDLPPWQVSDPITVQADGRIRFTGRITDVNMTHRATDPPEAVLALTCVGPVADLGRYDVGDIPWPLESSYDRADHILRQATAAYIIEGNPPLQVVARDVDRQRALDLVTGLAEDAGAAVFDTPDGVVVFQHFDARAQTWLYLLWSEAPDTWSDHPETWADTAVVSPSAPNPIELPCDAVAWEPVWTLSSGQIINHVTIGYGTPEPGYTQPGIIGQVPESIARYGRMHYGNDTQLADLGSAQYRAGLILDRRAQPRWAMSSVTLYPDDMEPATREDVLGLLCGARVSIAPMPAPSPAPTVVAVVEGWVQELSPHGNTITLNLSDPLHSYAGIVWNALDPATLWEDVDPALAWQDAIVSPDMPLARAAEVAPYSGQSWEPVAPVPDGSGGTGLPGPQGPPGPTGPAGTTGPAGPPGADSTVPGPTGPAGADGAPGAQGPPGATGPAGAPGATGPAGAPGATGPAGPVPRTWTEFPP